MSQISDVRHERNRQFLSSSFRQIFGLPMSAERAYVLANGSREELDAYVRTKQRKLLLMGIAAIGLGSLIGLIPHTPSAPPPEPLTSSAGRIEAVQLHETAFSTTTTVVTSDGTYQVRGAVSAAKGDDAKLKEERSPGMAGRKALCVESSIKRFCYDLL